MNATQAKYEEIVAAQKSNKVVAVIDAARTFLVSEAIEAGCDVPKLLVSQPDGALQANEVEFWLRRSGVVDLFVTF